MKVERFRVCGVCGVRNIPFGVDWPWWTEGQPAHRACLAEKLGGCMPDHPAPVIPADWTRMAPGIYHDREGVGHVVPHEMLEHLGIPHTLGNERLCEEVVIEFFTARGVRSERGEPLV